MLSVVSEVLPHGAAWIGSQVLKGRSIRCCGRHHNSVLHGIWKEFTRILTLRTLPYHPSNQQMQHPYEVLIAEVNPGSITNYRKVQWMIISLTNSKFHDQVYGSCYLAIADYFSSKVRLKLSLSDPWAPEVRDLEVWFLSFYKKVLQCFVVQKQINTFFILLGMIPFDQQVRGKVPRFF